MTTVSTTEPAPSSGTGGSPERMRLHAVLLSGERPPRPSPVSTSLTFGWRAMLKIRHVPEQLFDVTLFPVIFVLMFTYLFGGALAGSPRDYLQYLLPGILVQTILMITMYTGHTLNKEIQRGSFDRIRTLPIWQPTVLIGALLGDALRYSLGATVIVMLGLVLGFRPEGGVTGVVLGVALVLVFSFSLSWIWTALGIVMRTPESLMGVSMMVLFPLTFISNIFVDPATMPGWLQVVVQVNPVSYLVTATRELMAGNLPLAEVGWVFVASVALVAVFAPVTMHLYRRK
jgi:ABC-2 type transport system permease protein